MIMKPKRGVTKLIILETGEEVMYNTTTFDGKYLVDFPNGSFASFLPDELKLVTKGKTPISKAQKKLTEKEKSDKQLMNEFFDSLDCTIYCQECEVPLIAYTKFGKRSCCAHIVEKSTIESVKRNHYNIMFLGAAYLGGCMCHDLWDSNIESRMKMKIYPKALKQFELFKHNLTSAELIKCYEYLGIPLTKEILNQLK